jgi:hypothetical protein
VGWGGVGWGVGVGVSRSTMHSNQRQSNHGQT